MAWHDAFEKRMEGFSLPEWEEVPDLGLYMDQVITWLERYFRPLYGSERRIITPAMINNYVKDGLLARPKGKKYDRSQLAHLMMLCALKQVLSLDDLRILLQTPQEGTMADVYRLFCRQVRKVTEDVRPLLSGLTAMESAILAAAHTLLCEEMMHHEA